MWNGQKTSKYTQINDAKMFTLHKIESNWLCVDWAGLPVLRLSDRDWHKMAKYANFVRRSLILLSDQAKSFYWLGNNFVLRRIFVYNIHRLELNEWRGVSDQNAETKALCYLFISREYQAARFSGNKPRKTKEITKLSPQLSQPSLLHLYMRISAPVINSNESAQCSLASQAEPAVTTKEYINHFIMNVICFHTPKYTLLRTRRADGPDYCKKGSSGSEDDWIMSNNTGKTLTFVHMFILHLL